MRAVLPHLDVSSMFRRLGRRQVLSEKPKRQPPKGEIDNTCSSAAQQYAGPASPNAAFIKN